MSRTFSFNGIILFRNVLRMEVLTIVNGKTGAEWETFYRGLEKRKNGSVSFSVSEASLQTS